MNKLERILELSKEQCFSLWYNPDTDSYFTDNEKTAECIWICDVDREISSETVLRMTALVLRVTEELERKGYLKHG